MSEKEVAQLRGRGGSPTTGLPLEPLVAVGALLVLAAVLILALSYASVQPILVLAIFLALGMGLMFLPRVGGDAERRAFLLTFAMGSFWSGIAAIYANQLGDFYQLESDASFFYLLATTWANGKHVFAQTGIVDSTGPIIVWHYFYELFGKLGFSDGRFLGITINTFFVALTAVLGVKCVRFIHGDDRSRLRLYTLAFALMPILWMFAGMFIRESMILFALMLLAAFWIALLKSPSAWRLAALMFTSMVSYLCFVYLRGEFVLVPIAMLLAGGIALALASPGGAARPPSRAVGIMLLAFAGLLYWLPLLLQQAGDRAGLLWHIRDSQEKYAVLAADNAPKWHGGGSLAMELVVNQPEYIRVVLGSIYVWVFPIPFWVGFQLESFYHLTKSFQVLFNYAFIPALAVPIWRAAASFGRVRNSVELFLIFCIAGFTATIAVTSIETRHLGTFLPIFLLLVTMPDWSGAGNRLLMRNLTLVMLAGVALVHLAWLVLKGVL